MLPAVTCRDVMGRSAGPSARSSGAVTRFWKEGGLLCLLLLASAAVGQHGGQLGPPVFERLGPTRSEPTLPRATLPSCPPA